MEESESMVALKKAYAEMILNTAKEAAARVMASERKAARVHHDLSATKEEALRMLLRLKQMMDAKIAESERTSASQRGRIQELEAQLQEAEDKIVDLRMELRSVHDELEEAKKNQMGQTEEKSFSAKNGTTEDHFISFEPIVPYSSDSELETSVNLDVEDGSLSHRADNHKSCSRSNKAVHLVDPPLEAYHGTRSDLASMIMRRKEPELYRNGRTQRVRAFEGRMFDRTLQAVGNESSAATCALSYKKSDKDVIGETLGVQKELPGEEIRKRIKAPTKRRKKAQFGKYKTILQRSNSSKAVKCSETEVPSNCKLSTRNGNIKSGKDAHSGDFLRAENIAVQKNSGELRDKLQSSSGYLDGSKVNKGKRKRIARGRKYLATSFEYLSDQLNSPTKPSFLRRCNTNSLDAITISSDAWVKRAENEAGDEMASFASLDVGVRKHDQDCVSEQATIGTVVKEGQYIDDSGSVKQETNGVKVTLFPDGELDRKVTNVVLGLELNSGELARDMKGSIDPMPLKYTFQRKRKKEISNQANESSILQKSKVKKKVEDVDDGSSEPENSTSMKEKESTRDSRRLAQVARQLIALSGRRW